MTIKKAENCTLAVQRELKALHKMSEHIGDDAIYFANPYSLIDENEYDGYEEFSCEPIVKANGNQFVCIGVQVSGSWRDDDDTWFEDSVVNFYW